MKHDHETKHHDGWAVTNEMRLSLKQWVMVLVIVALVAIMAVLFAAAYIRFMRQEVRA